MGIDYEANRHLYEQLSKLGDMIGDGLADEPDGDWIRKEYRSVCKALGMTRPKANNSEAINKAMAKQIEIVKCKKCNGKIKQTRSGSLRAVCTVCGTKLQFSRTKRKR